jgi:hypothetical protein
MATTWISQGPSFTAEVLRHSGKAGSVPATAEAGGRSQTMTYAEITAFVAEAAARFPESLSVKGSHLPGAGYGKPGERLGQTGPSSSGTPAASPRPGLNNLIGA